MRFHIGEKVKVCGGSGCDSGKVGVIIPRSQVPMKQTNGGLIPDLEGHYKPVDWGEEVPVLLDDDTIITMYKNRLTKVD